MKKLSYFLITSNIGILGTSLNGFAFSQAPFTTPSVIKILIQKKQGCVIISDKAQEKSQITRVPTVS